MDYEAKLQELREKYKGASTSMRVIIKAQAKALKNAQNLANKKKNDSGQVGLRI